ncbi:MAG: GNAT family N-acetyltransferase, partial [Oscillospiraceae bacterium]|nr:GNAT family N-acetyltransferase [Oscillospiraceae bacterium]
DKELPVGYLEGIYLKEPFRGRGLGRALAGRREDWARRRGCSGFASGCETENTGSLRSRLASGFREAGRIICFVKPLTPREESESDAG